MLGKYKKGKRKKTHGLKARSKSPKSSKNVLGSRRRKGRKKLIVTIHSK